MDNSRTLEAPAAAGQKQSRLRTIKLSSAELFYDLRRSSLDRNSAWFWWRRMSPLRFEYVPHRFDASPHRLLEAFALAFCLTRADERTPIRGHDAGIFLEAIGELGLSLNTVRGLHGAALKRAPNYLQLAGDIFRRLEKHLESEPGMVACLQYLADRYVGHRRRDTGRVGLVKKRNLTTVPTQKCATRYDGAIWTFSQQSCTVYAFVAADRLALGHWTFAPSTRRVDAASVNELADSHAWKHVRIIARPGQDYESLEHHSPLIYDNPPDVICSIGLVKATEGYRILRESHTRSDSVLSLGPSVVVPANAYEHLEEIKISG